MRTPACRCLADPGMMEAMEDFLKPPPGWRYEAYPWFALDDISELPELVQVGPVLLPEFFHLVIGTEDSWYTDRDTAVEHPHGGDCTLFLNFQVFEEGIMVAEARASYDDIPRVFERVGKIIKPDKWKRLGIHCMTQYLLRFMDEGGRPPGGPLTTDGAHGERRPRAAMEWLERLQDHASDAYAQARDTPAPRRRRNRITDDFLKDVAHTYRVAENMGMPPTREVANHFKAPHSTAAKWVATARRKKFLPPAGSSTRPSPDELAILLDAQDERERLAQDQGGPTGTGRQASK